MSGTQVEIKVTFVANDRDAWPTWLREVADRERMDCDIARDVVRAVDARYRTIPTGRGRALAGLSEGGYGALNIGLHHPREFQVLESWSGYERADDIGAVFGHRPALLRANSPQRTIFWRASALRREHTMIWFYSGTGDHELAQNQRFARTLATLDLQHRFYVVRGGHDWALWRGNAARAYLAASKGLRGA